MTDPVHEPPPPTVLYDGTCPLCRREIGVDRLFLRVRPVLQRWASRLDSPFRPAGRHFTLFERRT